MSQQGMASTLFNCGFCRTSGLEVKAVRVKATSKWLTADLKQDYCLVLDLAQSGRHCVGVGDSGRQQTTTINHEP